MRGRAIARELEKKNMVRKMTTRVWFEIFSPPQPHQESAAGSIGATFSGSGWALMEFDEEHARPCSE
jgi:hypothetical protein